jgi:hypothetical protein
MEVISDPLESRFYKLSKKYIEWPKWSPDEVVEAVTSGVAPEP